MSDDPNDDADIPKTTVRSFWNTRDIANNLAFIETCTPASPAWEQKQLEAIADCKAELQRRGLAA